MSVYQHERTDPLDNIRLGNDFVKEVKMRIVKDFLDIIVLLEMKNRSGLSGYDIIVLVNARFGTLISSGTVYSVMYSLERKGFVKGVSNGRKTGYTLTEKGRETLDSIQHSRNELKAFMQQFFAL